MSNVMEGNIKIIADFFLVSLAFCYNLFSPLAGSELTGNGFIKLISNLSIGALIISFGMTLSGDNAFIQLPIILKSIALISFILISFFHRDKKTWIMWILNLIIFICLGLFIFIFLANAHTLNFLFLISSSLLLGCITYAMTLGHWYLVVPKLSEKPLVKAALITWAILLLKIIFSFYETYLNWDFFAEGTSLGSGFAFNWLLLSMRTMFGYVVILGMSYFNYRLVKMRSIQSSTGILYAMTFFVFIGELISSYLFFYFGLLI